MMISNLLKSQKISVTFFLLYSSLLMGFYFDENLNFGAYFDWLYTDTPVINASAENFKNTILNYDNFGHRHSPVYLVFLGFLKKIGLSLDTLRFLHLNLSLLLIYLFYKCLNFKFNYVDKSIILILSFSLFLSPTFRSLSIWPSTRIIGLIFFVMSIYEFLKYQKFGDKIYIWKNVSYLILCSYISPNFSIFIIFFFYHYFKKENFRTNIQIFIFCIFLSIPAIYYIFILNVNFLVAGTPGSTETDTIGFSFNFSNKILIISTIILFHLLPFILNKNFFIEIRKFPKKYYIFLLSFLFLNIYFFNYVTNYTGGGIFFQFSNYILDNNYFFHLISFISLILLGFLSYNNLNNFLVFFILIISNIQNTIYHKYYDPLVLILFFTLISTSLSSYFLSNRKYLFYLYGFYFFFIFTRILKNYYLV